MNAERLLATYDRVADAPDAVPSLRRFVLDLAVRGKLVEQDPNDEPASELLKRIEEEKIRLVKARMARKGKKPPPAEDSPTQLPNAWCWTEIAEVGWISPRNDFPDDHIASFVPMRLIPTEYVTFKSHEMRQWGDIKKGYTHFAEGDVGLAKITPCFENGKSVVFRNLAGGIGSGTTELHVVRPIFVDADYIVIFLKSPLFIENGILRMTGTAGQKRVSLEYFANSPFPLPPLTEQRRIVSKVDELMALCDQLERTRNEREQTRDRLTKSSYARLTTSDTDETFQVSARFVANAFPALTARADQIKQLRQTILDLAVRGKLVEQDPVDEPAAELLKRIAAEKALLKQETCDSRIKPAADPANEGYPGPLPDTWKVQSFENLFLFIDYRGRTPPKTGRGIPLITAKNIRFGNLNREPREFIAQETFETWMTRGFPQLGDLFFTTEAPLANVCLNDIQEPFALAQRVICLQPYGEISTRYIMFAIMSDVMQTLIGEHSTGLTAKGIKAAKLKPLPIPLPPLAEQYRIVVRVDELMALCDRLETSLAVSDATRARLLESLLHEALTPVAAVDDLAHASPASIPPVNAEVAAEPLSSA